MEPIYSCEVEFDHFDNANITVVKTTGEGPEAVEKRSGICISKAEGLGEIVRTVWGEMPWSNFPVQRDEILAKWAEIA